MQWLWRNVVGLLGLALAIIALVCGVDAYRSGVQRDEQAPAIPRRLERGETELAEQHKKTVAALSGLVNALRPLTYSIAALALVVGVWDARRRKVSFWMTGVTIMFAVFAVGFALESGA